MTKYPTLTKILEGQSVYAITKARKGSQIANTHRAISRELRALLKRRPELLTHLKDYL